VPDYLQGQEGWAPDYLDSGPGKDIAEGAGGILLEPYDWYVTGREIYHDPLNPWNYAGFIPFFPASADNILRRMTPDQQALKELVEEATNRGRNPLSNDNADTVLDWADETDFPGWRAGPNDVGGAHGPGPHINLPGVGDHGGHIPIEPGVCPRVNPNLNPRQR
jgi:hypothetical protein